MESIIHSRPPEFYKNLHEDKILMALGWLADNRDVAVIRIMEPDLETHIEKNWGKNDEAYRAEKEKWRGWGRLKNLTRIETKTGDHAYVVDTNDLIIDKPSDEFLFFQLGSCWGVNVDIEYENEPKRVAFHMGGNTPDKKVSMEELVKSLKDIGASVSTINVFYSRANYGTSSEKNIADDAFLGEINVVDVPVKFFDLESMFPWGAYDVIVKEGEAKQFHNKGLEPDWEKEEFRVERAFDGTWQLK
jgi:hypothetical protein